MFILIKKQELGELVNNVVNLSTFARRQKVLKNHNIYIQVLPIMENYLINLRKFSSCDNITVLIMMLEMDIEEIKHCIEDCRVKLFELEKELHE